MPSHAGVYIRSLHFAIWMAVGTFWPFLYVYYNRIGLSGTEVGLVITVSSLAGTLAATLWGMLNDRLGRVRLLLTVLSVGAIAVCQWLGLQRSVAGVVLVAGLFSVFTSPIMPLLDSTTLALLGDHREQYGAYRVWGTIGFVVASALMGVVIGHLGMGHIFLTYGLGVAAFAALVQRLPDRPVGSTLTRTAGLTPMIRRHDWLLFAASVFILWFSVMGASAFLGIVIVQMGGSERLVGLAATIAALTEIPFFQFSSRILRRVGPERLLVIAIAIYVLRLVLWGIMPNPSWVLWLALLQGASYGPFLVGVVAYTDRLAPEGLKATSQGLMVSVMSLANLVAGLAGGWLLDHSGRSGLYFTMAATCLGALALFGFGWLQAHRPRWRRAAPRVGGATPE